MKILGSPSDHIYWAVFFLERACCKEVLLEELSGDFQTEVVNYDP